MPDVQIVARGPSSVRMKFKPGIVGATGDITPAALAAKVDAQTAAAIAVDAASDAVSQSNVPIYSSRSAIAALSIPVGISFFRVNGFSSSGDGGTANYKKAASEPAHDGKVQSLDGAWWELNEPVVNAKMLGAKGDGTTNDRTALQKAIDVATALSLNCYLPSGTYNISTGLVLDKAAIVSLYGDGMYNTRIRGNASWAGGSYIAHGNATPSGAIKSSITDIALVGPLVSTANGIAAQNANSARYEGILFENLVTPISLDASFAVTITGCVADVTTSNFLYSAGPAHHLVIENNKFYSVGGGAAQAIRVDTATDNIVIERNVFEFCASVCYLVDPRSVRIVGNYIEVCDFEEFAFGGTARNVFIESNWIALNGAGGVSYNNIDSGSFKGNTVYDQDIVFGSAAVGLTLGRNYTFGTASIGQLTAINVSSLLNTYTLTDPTNAPVEYHKNNESIVTLSGQISGGVSSSSDVAFNLPEPYRPRRDLYVPAITAATTVTTVIIATNGNVVPLGIGNGQTVRLDGITFVAA